MKRQAHPSLQSGGASRLLLLLTCSAVGCNTVGCNIGVSASRMEAQSPAAEVSDEVTTASQSSVAEEICPKGVQVAADGLLDNLDDGNTQVNQDSDRDGFWWTTKDKVGSTLEPSENFTPMAGGPEGSTMAIHVQGTTAMGDAAWGVGVGLNISSAGLYDASRYVGIRFKARVEPNSSKRVRFKIGDVNTHADAGLCKSCWNHFGKDMTLSESWQEYTLFFKELTQAAGWGDPRPKELSVNQLYSMDFSIDKGQTYNLWVDELEFVECKP